jgi:large subunit ribosomal protein L1
MGKPKIVNIDDSIEEPKKGAKKAQVKVEKQPEAVGATQEVEVKSEEKKAPIAEKKAEKKAKGSKAAAKKTAPERKQKHSNKYIEAAEKREREKRYKIDEAIELAKQVSYSKFSGSLEVHINTNTKGTRGLVTLPFAAGKKLTILAFGNGADKSGADIVGTDEIIAAVEKGKINFDVVVTTPQWMPKLARVARVLGPRGLMPNPKSGTITDNLSKAVEELQAGKTEYKTEKDAPVVHLRLGALAQPTEELSANLKALYTTIGKSRIKKITIAPTMGPGVKVDISSL